MPRFLTAREVPPSSCSTLAEFYREEFVKHHRCLQAQREYFTQQAIENVETALLRVIAQMDKLSTREGADVMVAQLLREFDVVTGLSAWSDRDRVH